MIQQKEKKIPELEEDDEDDQVQEDDDNETTSNTTPDPDDPEVQYVDNVIIDEADWSLLSVEEKIASNTGSFSYMSWEEKCNVSLALINQHTIIKLFFPKCFLF